MDSYEEVVGPTPTTYLTQVRARLLRHVVETSRDKNRVLRIYAPRICRSDTIGIYLHQPFHRRINGVTLTVALCLLTSDLVLFK